MSAVYTSAPAKVILFGEHLVVHGATAITTALDLRTFARVAPVSGDAEPRIHINLPDIHAVANILIKDLDYSGAFVGQEVGGLFCARFLRHCRVANV